MLSKNEWDPLKKVIVGIADNAQIPKNDISLRVINYADKDDDYVVKTGYYPQQVIDEANEDLEKFVEVLKKENVEVLRPDNTVNNNYYNYCPRDSVIVHDDLILATPQPLRARHNEYLSMDSIFSSYNNIRYVKKQANKHDSLYNLNCLGNKDVLALNETEPCFDAANVIRDNDNLYYLVSNSGNVAGADYLQELVGNKKKVYKIQGVYAYMHIDSTITLLREGLMLLNPSRVKSIEQLPKPLQSWDVIWAPTPQIEYHYPGYCHASVWINVNLFSINPNLVVIHENETNLRSILNKHKIDSIMLPGRHQRTLGGGFHCVTLDLERKH